MKLDISKLPVTDIHCFSFAATKKHTRGSLAKLFMAGGPTVKSVSLRARESDLEATVAYRRMVHWLAHLLKSRDDDLAVLAKRNQRASDFTAYVRLLFEDARIEGMALDNGLEPVSFEVFRRYAPCRLHRVFRIEPLLKRLLESSETFDALVDSFDEVTSSAVKRDGFAGFKTVIAYRTGLDVTPSDEGGARSSFKAYKKGAEAVEWFGPRVKPVRDFILSRLAERANRLGVFLQIHTGFGDTDIVAERCDPMLLKNFLSQESVLKIPVILIHGGFPYTMEAAWLANVFPNIFFELSTPLPPYFVPPLSKARFRQALEMVPTTRIVYGSDAIETPENHWMSAKLAKLALAETLEELVAERTLDEDYAIKVSGRILSQNALALLKSPVTR